MQLELPQRVQALQIGHRARERVGVEVQDLEVVQVVERARQRAG